MIIDSYQRALDFLYGLTDFETRADPAQAALFDLRRMKLLLRMLGEPHIKARSVHIAGTKGKGSTAAMISSVLSCAGHKTGLYTSPHLVDLTERISVDGKDISRQEITDIVAELQPIISHINFHAEYGKLSTFEVLTAMGFVYFARNGAKLQVLETGMGGRLDATNVIEPLVAVITLIGLDHTAVLGNTLGLIAGEKAGIIKRGSTVVSAVQPEAAAVVIREQCLKKEAKLIDVGNSIQCRHAGYENRFQLFEIISERNSYDIKLPLVGSYQGGNLCCAVAALEELTEKGIPISKEEIEVGLQRVNWPGRFQVVTSHPLVIVDGAHNPEAIRALMGSLDHYIAGHGYKNGRRTLVLGISSDKDLQGMAALLRGFFNRVIITRSTHPRSMEPGRVALAFTDYGTEVITTRNMHEALNAATKGLAREDLVLITGSLFVAGEALAILRTGGKL
jgi:dihydrofolate synthase/folylpolyglutamate synthase